MGAVIQHRLLGDQELFSRHPPQLFGGNAGDLLDIAEDLLLRGLIPNHGRGKLLQPCGLRLRESLPLGGLSLLLCGRELLLCGNVGVVCSLERDVPVRVLLRELLPRRGVHPIPSGFELLTGPVQHLVDGRFQLSQLIGLSLSFLAGFRRLLNLSGNAPVPLGFPLDDVFLKVTRELGELLLSISGP